MQPDIFFIPVNAAGKLAQMPRPRAGEWLRDELEQIRDYGIDQVVSMLEPSEEYALGLGNEMAMWEQFGGTFARHPIPDMCLPGNTKSFIALGQSLAEDIRRGRGVAIHCRAGIGRSGMMTCAVLTQFGLTVDEALQHITHYRGLRVPDTTEQADWLRENLAPAALS